MNLPNILVSSLLLMGVGQPHQATKPLHSAQLTGVVTDPQGAVFQDSSRMYVLLKSDKRLYREPVRSNGEYRIKVSPGVYRVSVEGAPFGGYYERAPILLLPSSTTYLRLTLLLRNSGVSFRVGKSGAHNDWEVAPIHGAREFQVDACGDAIPAMIQWLVRDSDGEWLVYEHAILSFSNWTLSANKIRINMSTQDVDLIGNIKVEHGNEPQVDQRAEFRLNLRTVIEQEGCPIRNLVERND